MAPFRRGKPGPRNGYTAVRGGFKSGRGGRRGGFQGTTGTNAGPRKDFQSSRIEKTVNNQSNGSDVASEIGSLNGESDGQLTIEASPESDVATENPYTVLLQSLNPATSLGEPKRKRRKIKQTGAAKLASSTSGILDVLHDVEGEESPSEEDNEVQSDADDGLEDHDLFTRHFVDQDELAATQRIQAVNEDQWVVEKTTTGSSWSSTLRSPSISKATGVLGDRKMTGIKDVKLKPKLERTAERLLTKADDLLCQLTSSVFSYQDVLFSARSLNNAETIRTLVSLHALNHVFRTRDKVLKNNARLSRNDGDEDFEARDQGFTRPKVLILMPTRQSCVKMVNVITTISEPEQQENKKRFQDSYARVDDNLSPDKPEDFKDLFGGNDDDMFRLGLKFTRKTVKFFSQFYSSDIILASPLGLRTALEGDNKKKQDYDFLSSIEVVVVDQSEALLMQNWEHVEYVLEHLNLQPREAHGCDFSRVRPWYLDGHTKYYRQTVLFSAFNFPSLNKLYTRHMLNIAGKIKFSKSYDGAIMDIGIPIRQTFSRFDSVDPSLEPDNRFDYFVNGVLPSLVRTVSHGAGGHMGILLFVPLYAEFVRLRNYFASSSSTQHVSFGSISEYTQPKEVARARSHFLTGRHSILLYTERAHHFRRYRLKGVKKVILYGLPENSLFYQEIVGGFLGSGIAEAKVDSRHVNVRCLFSKLDLLKLERVVGTKRYLSLLSEKGDTFEFT
ncbi:MAG: hypothetical protein Q9201_007770 [Fulgogasparrea decipioides]